MRRALLSLVLVASCSSSPDPSQETSATSPQGTAGASGATSPAQAGAAGAPGAAGQPNSQSAAQGGGTAMAGAAAGGAQPAPAGPKPRDITWTPCPLRSTGEGPEAACGALEVPLRPGDEDGETLSYFVKRYRTGEGPFTRQLHMLAGGPGSSGMLYEPHAELLAREDPSLEIYLPDHRGTGRSSRLSCPLQESDDSSNRWQIADNEWPACIDHLKATWGDRLAWFGTTPAAHDIGVLIESTRTPGQQVFVYGASYGTCWAHRYLQLFPAQADGVILDAIAPPLLSLARQDIDADDTARELFSACAADDGCRARLGDDPRARAVALYEKLDAGHCADVKGFGLSVRELLRRSFGQMMMGWGGKMLIPAVIARAERCEKSDRNALRHLFKHYFGSSNTLFFKLWGWALSDHVTYSELWEGPPVTEQQLQAWREQAVVSRDVTTGFTNGWSTWPTYPKDEHHGRFADTATPMLMLQGTWDPATITSGARTVGEHFNREHQHYVEIERGGHGVLLSAPTVDGGSCGTELVRAFIASPKAPLDTGCTGRLRQLSFDGTAEVNELLLGEADAWGGL